MSAPGRHGPRRGPSRASGESRSAQHAGTSVNAWRFDPATLAAPELERCTDPGAMRGLLQRHLPGFDTGALRIDSVAVSKVRRNTSLHRNPCRMTLCYELGVVDTATGRSGTQLLYAKVFRAGLSEACAAPLDRHALARPRFGPGAAHVPALDMVIWALPNDPVLSQLPVLLGDGVVDVAPWAALGMARDSVAGCRTELLRYEPEQRATLRFTIDPGGGGASRVVYAKTFRDGRARDLFERFDHFARQAQVDAGAPLVARPLGHSEATRTLWQEAASGTPWLAWVAAHAGSAAALPMIRAAAGALALLHEAPLAPSAQTLARTAAHWVGESRRRQNKISRAAPHLSARVARVADAIGARAERQTARRPSLIHGDFHPDQLWVHEGRIVLFDFDEFALGDPMEDLAEFVIKLEQAGAHTGIAASFIEAYAGCAPQRFDRTRLAWHLTVQSLLQASRAFVYQRPGWEGELDGRLAACEARAAMLAETPAP